VFTSGYVSNQTGIATIAKLLPDCLILSDARNHNSMIEGIRQSGVERQIWRHSDVDHLETLLRAVAGRPKLIAFESLYSMDGDVAPIRRICELAELCIKPMRSWLVPCYEPTPPDPLACCDASLPALS